MFITEQHFAVDRRTLVKKLELVKSFIFFPYQSTWLDVPGLQSHRELKNTIRYKKLKKPFVTCSEYLKSKSMLERIYNPITAMGFLAMFTFELDNTKSL